MEQEHSDMEEKERTMAVAAAIREMEAELAHVSRALTVGELATSIAHEVNQPLAAIVTNAEACLRWLKAKPSNLQEVQDSLDLIVRDGNRASEVIYRIREFLKKDSKLSAELSMNEVVEEAIAMAQPELRKMGVAIRLELAPDLPTIWGDRIQLQQVILNLMMNGREAMAFVANDLRELTVFSQRSEEGPSIAVGVRDSGIGMDSRTMDRMFDAFYTTKPAGMGMGLSISRSIIEAHGGRIWATPNKVAGITVQFTVPTGRETS
jgi:C4-dicarboxylate-specific signal transduction histidine kinase